MNVLSSILLVWFPPSESSAAGPMEATLLRIIVGILLVVNLFLIFSRSQR
jgi:hypothetical protein